MARKAKSKSPESRIEVEIENGEDEGLAVVKTVLGPNVRHALAIQQVNTKTFGEAEGAPSFVDYTRGINDFADQAEQGNLAFASRILAAQAVTLDSIFTEMARRMAINMGEYMGATETYGRIAMKAQAQSRATLDALAKLHQPREQTVRHVHVNEGGQAIVADQFHHHAGGQENGPICDQPHEQGSCSPALPSPNPFGNGVPIACNEGQEAVPVARRTIDGSA